METAKKTERREQAAARRVSAFVELESARLERDARREAAALRELERLGVVVRETSGNPNH